MTSVSVKYTQTTNMGRVGGLINILISVDTIQLCYFQFCKFGGACAMEAESPGKEVSEPDAAVPVPKLGPGKTFKLDMQMMPPDENGRLSASMTPMKVLADGTKVVLDPNNHEKPRKEKN
jgi:hypothetical protein